MLALRLPKDIEDRLEALARKTGRTKSFYARQAILEHMQDLEDYFLAEEILARDDGSRFTLDDIRADLADDARGQTVAE